MKMLCLLLSLCFLPHYTSMPEADANEVDPYSVAQVKALLAQPVGFSSGWSEKEVYRLGDRAAIALLKIYNEKEIESSECVRRYLPIMEAAFQYPNLISLPEDRQPRITLLLLRFLKTDVKDTKLNKEILKTEQSIRSLTNN